jgi:hypothetical protein
MTSDCSRGERRGEKEKGRELKETKGKGRGKKEEELAKEEKEKKRKMRNHLPFVMIFTPSFET